MKAMKVLENPEASFAELMTIAENLHHQRIKDRKMIIEKLLSHPANKYTSMIERMVVCQLISRGMMNKLKFDEIIALIPHVVHGGSQEEFIWFMKRHLIKKSEWYKIVNAYNEAETRQSCVLGYWPKLIDDQFYGIGLNLGD